MRKITSQKGLTLIELMITVVLSMVVIYFVMNIMITSSRTSMQSEGLAQAQENGRFILSWLHTETRRAGYIPGIVEERIQPFADICTTELPRPPAAGAACTFESSDVSDRLAIQRTFISDSPTLRDRTDCTGIDLTGTQNDGDILTDVYWVERDFNPGGGIATDDAYDDVLRCVTYFNNNIVAPAQVIASGIEGLHVLYGIRPNQDDQRRTNIHRYVSLSDVAPVDWDSVRSARIAILTRSFSDTTLANDTRSYILLDADPATFTDRIARHIQSTTVYLPNE